MRSTILEVLTRLPKDDGTALTIARKAIERDGWTGAFESTHLLGELTVNQESLEWAVSSLPLTNPENSDPAPAIPLLKMISRGNPTWLAEQQQELIRKIKKSVANLSPQSLAALTKTIKQRIHFDARNSSECYEEIQNYCAKFDTESAFDDFDTQFIDIATDRIAEENDLETIEPSIVQTLSEVSTEEFRDGDWFAGTLIILAGKIKCTGAISTLLTLFDSDWDWWNEQIPLAVSRMASDEVLDQIASTYFQLPNHGRLFLSDSFASFRTPHTASVLESILSKESDPDHRWSIAEGLAIQFNDSAAGKARAVLDEAPANIHSELLMQILYTHAQLDNPGFEEIDVQRWKDFLRDQLEKRQQHRERMQTSSLLGWAPTPPADTDSHKGTPIVSETPKIGRNEPCPCGSGKKYKKCCLN